jgi:hypothetical protein
MNPLIALGAALVGGVIARAVSSGDETAKAQTSNQAARGGPGQQSYVVTPVTPAGTTGEAAANHYSVVHAE